jgi:hypothetical protein
VRDPKPPELPTDPEAPRTRTQQIRIARAAKSGQLCVIGHLVLMPLTRRQP